MISTRFLSIADFELYGSWLREQSEETLTSYFGIAVNETYITQLIDGIISNPEEHHFLVAMQGDTWAGVIHMARISERDMEFGIMVTEQFRNQGIADLMMSQAITWIRNRGFDTLYLHCVTWNRIMKHLADKHGLDMQEDHGDADVCSRIPPPSLISYAQEAATHNRNIFIMSLQNRWFPFNELMG
jgi:RimJ/RimL family protein N-acetyltransferase